MEVALALALLTAFSAFYWLTLLGVPVDRAGRWPTGHDVGQPAALEQTRTGLLIAGREQTEASLVGRGPRPTEPAVVLSAADRPREAA
jgi:hypothetical protein